MEGRSSSNSVSRSIGGRWYLNNNIIEEERERKAATRIQAVVRGWLCRKKFKSLSKFSMVLVPLCPFFFVNMFMAEGRTIVARELLGTERDYVRYLSLIIQV